MNNVPTFAVILLYEKFLGFILCERIRVVTYFVHFVSMFNGHDEMT